ncbi:hypothetical protein C6341_g24967 [Phytophthora cactorum]|nr:hypothetical protein C6341_g24967 [Phytophthora cactorum]
MTTQTTSDATSSPIRRRPGPDNIPPLVRTSKRAESRGAIGAALADARKGKKKATKWAAASNTTSTGREKPEEGEGDASDQELDRLASQPPFSPAFVPAFSHRRF